MNQSIPNYPAYTCASDTRKLIEHMNKVSFSEKLIDALNNAVFSMLDNDRLRYNNINTVGTAILYVVH